MRSNILLKHIIDVFSKNCRRLSVENSSGNFLAEDRILQSSDPFNFNKDNSIKEMVKCKMHIGHQYPNKLNRFNQRFLLGVRHGFCIFDLSISYLHLRQAANFAALTARHGGVVMFYSYTHRFNLICQTAARRCKQYYFCGDWIPGTFLNPEKYLHCEEVVESGGIVKKARLPDIIVAVGLGSFSIANRKANFLSSISEKHISEGILSPPCADLLKEAHENYIPVIGLLDSDCNPHHVSYPVPGNDDNMSSVNYFYQSISNAIIAGSKK